MPNSLILYHVSPARHRNSISKRGLLLRKSNTATPAVWLCSKQYLHWALLHISQHQQTAVWDLDVWLVLAKRHYLRRIRRGIWVSFKDIPVHNLNLSHEDKPTIHLTA